MEGQSDMNFKELIEKKITGEGEELTRRKDLWREIVDAYEKGGIDKIKSLLSDKSNEILEKFQGLMKQLENKL